MGAGQSHTSYSERVLPQQLEVVKKIWSNPHVSHSGLGSLRNCETLKDSPRNLGASACCFSGLPGSTLGGCRR